MSPIFSAGHTNKFGLVVPVTKSFGASASGWFKSSLRAVKGRPFMMGSIWVKYEYNVTLLKILYLVMVFKFFFVIFAIAFMAPFIHGLTSGLSFQLIFWGSNSFSILSWSKHFSDLKSSLWTPVKLIPLSLKMFFGCHFLEMNRRKASMKLPVGRLPTSCIRSAQASEMSAQTSENSSISHRRSICWKCTSPSFTGDRLEIVYSCICEWGYIDI